MGGLIQNIELSGSELPKLAALREKGKRSFLQQKLPTPKTEAFKYTKLRELEAKDFVIEQSVECQDCHCHDKPVLPFAVYEIKFCNGILAHNHFHLADGLEAMSLLNAIYDNETNNFLNKNFDMDTIPFAALNTAYLKQGLFLRINKNITADKPIALIYHTDGKQKTLNNIHNIIIAENNSNAEIIEYYYCSGEIKSEYFNNIVNEFHIGRNANISYNKLQNESFKATHIAFNAVKIRENGKFESFCLQKGAGLSRHETYISLREEYAKTSVNTVYMMNGWATIDTTTNIEHLAPQTTSAQIVKGVVGGQARGVFQGKIHIAPNAIKTEGCQLHKALLLSDDAEIDTKPELEIYADDVKCSHGAACGKLDLEQMFYLRSRGIGEEDARNLLIRAFIDETLDLITNENTRAWLKDTAYLHN